MNQKKIVAFQELLDRYPPVVEALSGMGLEIVSVSGGREAISKLWDTQAGYVLLDVAMPQLSGIEVCRQIKEGGLFSSSRVILVSTVSSQTIADRAADAGCDLFLTADTAARRILAFLGGADAVIPTVSETSVPEDGGAAVPETAPRDSGPVPTAPRVAMTGPIQLTVSGERKVGDLINLSQSGVLFALGEILPDGSPLHVQFSDHLGGEILLDAAVVRTITLKEQRRGLAYATGVRFINVPEEKNRQIIALMVLLKEEADRAAAMHPGFVEQVVASNVHELSVMLLDASPESPLAFLGPLTDYERAAFTAEDARAECVRKTVLLRAKCGVLGAFVPRVRADPGTFADPFLERVASVVAQADGLDEETEKQVKLAVAAEDEAQRIGLNETSTRLHEAKTRLLENVTDGLTFKGLGTGLKTLEDIRNRVAAFRDTPMVSESRVRYDRRSQKAEPEKEENKKKDKTRGGVLRTVILVGIALSLIGGVTLWSYFSNRISPEEIKLSLAIDRVEQEESGLVLRVHVRDWDQLKGKAREDMFGALETYMREKKVRQTKIVDETGRLLAAVTAGSLGMERSFGRRIFRE